MKNTPREEADITAAIEAAQRPNVAGAPGISLADSVEEMGRLYVMLKEMGVDKEYILDLIRIPFMFAAAPDKPEMVADTLADIDSVDRSN